MRKKLTFTVLVLIVISIAVFLYRKVQAQQANYGDIIGWYRNVPAYSNGENTGTNEGDYQCVPYIKRFYRNPSSFDFNSELKTLWGYAFEAVSKGPLDGLIVYNQNSIVPPLPNEILCFGINSSAPVGHVAIITEVNVNGGAIQYLLLIKLLF